RRTLPVLLPRGYRAESTRPGQGPEPHAAGLDRLSATSRWRSSDGDMAGHASGMTRQPPATRPLSILIAAMGGQGGGVLSGWIVDAITRAGFPAQATSIPGVAQRTGATTYYIEFLPL